MGERKVGQEAVAGAEILSDNDIDTSNWGEVLA
jgi:hypothetical protein